MAQFRVLELDPAGQMHALDGIDAVAPPPPGARRWIDLADQDDATLELLRERFQFHPLAIEDCAHLDQRPKVEEYGDHLFLVTQGFTCPTPRVKHLEIHELHAFLGEHYLVTVHAGVIPALEDVWRRASAEKSPIERGLDFVYYLIADSLVDSNFPILDRIADELEELEDSVLESPSRKQLLRIFELKRHLVTMRKVISPQRDTMATLARRGDARVSERTAVYFRDVYDHLSRINESIEVNRDLLGNARDAYLSAVSNRTNEIMKALTLLSAVFLPLSFVVGFFGQNFENLPGLHDWTKSSFLMDLMIGTCVAIPIAML
ncbi:MAG TPA: magnesium/cobalt transporter CorA, partial [Polyangiaceae bacterium]|nr:magnesium/cobalt transporter CorA [Polyangiaceae bacterium]